MSHEIETAFFGNNEAAWHNLGTVIEADTVTSAEALKLAGLDWKVTVEPDFQRLRDGSYRENPGAFQITRETDEKVLGNVGARYVPVQNHEAFAFGDELVDSASAHWHTAGSLFGGRSVWMLMRLDKEIKIAGMEDEVIDPFVCINNSHDGSSSMSAIVTPVRVVCRNTQALAISTAKRKFSIRHTKNALDKVYEARRVLGVAFQYFEELERVGNEMVESKFSDQDFQNFLDSLYAVPEEKGRGRTTAQGTQEMVRELYQNAPNLQNVKGTRWGALQSVIELRDHHGTARKQNNDSAHVRMNRIVTGDRKVQEAFELLKV